MKQRRLDDRCDQGEAIWKRTLPSQLNISKDFIQLGQDALLSYIRSLSLLKLCLCALTYSTFIYVPN